MHIEGGARRARLRQAAMTPRRASTSHTPQPPAAAPPAVAKRRLHRPRDNVRAKPRRRREPAPANPATNSTHRQDPAQPEGRATMSEQQPKRTARK
jgi:hypothetical protein